MPAVASQTRLLKSALSNVGPVIANLAVAYLVTPFTIAVVGQAGYGIWALMLTVVGYAGVLDLGVGPAITHFVAERAAKEDWPGVRRFISGSLSLLLLAGLLLILLGAYGDETLAEFLHVPAELRAEFVTLVHIVAVTAALVLVSRLPESVLSAYEKYPLQNTLKCVVSVVRGVATGMALFYGGGLVSLGYVFLGTTLLQLLLFAGVTRRLPHGPGVNPLKADRSVYWALVTFGGTVSIISVTDILRFRLGNLVAAKYLGFDEVGLFNIASMLAGYFITAVAMPTAVLLPRFSRQCGQGDTDGLRRLFLRSSRLTALVASWLGLMILVGSAPFLQVWLGRRYSPPQLATCDVVIRVLVAIYVVVLSQASTVNLLYGMRRERFVAVVNVAEGVVVLLLSIGLVRQYGLTGLAIATALPLVIGKMLIQPIYVARLMGLPLRDYLGRRLAGPWLLCAVLYGAQRQVAAWVSFEGWWRLTASVGAAGLLFAGLGYVLLMDAQDRAHLRQRLPWAA
jgi:O-antigen/teichoic acid export membrane protein